MNETKQSRKALITGPEIRSGTNSTPAAEWTLVYKPPCDTYTECRLVEPYTSHHYDETKCISRTREKLDNTVKPWNI